MRNTERTLAIIGGGSVAVSYLHHLIREVARSGCGSRQLRVVVFDPNGAVGRGGAYALDSDTNLLNVTVSAMSADGSDRRHFRRWLHEKGIASFEGREIGDASFVSRPLFGRYLEDVYLRAVEAAALLGVRVEHCQSSVTAIDADGPDRLIVRHGQGGSQVVDHVVLSIGNLEPTGFRHLIGAERYFATPYPTLEINRSVPKDATVCVLGTSLSAIDSVLSLAAGGHRGRIFALSREGRLPSVRSVHNQPVAIHSSLKSQLAERHGDGRDLPLDELISLLRSGLSAAVGEEGVIELAQLVSGAPLPHQFLNDEIVRSSSRPRQWQAFANATNEIVDMAWHLLTSADRRRFEREFRSVWMARRVTFPLENALKLQALVREGQLHIAGGVGNVERNGEGTFTVALLAGSELAKSFGRTVQVDAVVNATSFSSNVALSSMPLLKQLLASGLVVPDPFGGVRADFETGRVIRADGSANRRMTALGSLVAGTYFWTNAMETNARIAMSQARRLVASLKTECSIGDEEAATHYVDLGGARGIRHMMDMPPLPPPGVEAAVSNAPRPADGPDTESGSPGALGGAG